MITPLDIENKEFKKGIRGYKESEVDQFLDEIKEDYERLYKENVELKDKLKISTDQLDRYKGIEETLKNTLIVAQNTAEEISGSAHKKSELIIEEAQLKGRKMIEEANNEVIKIRYQYEELRKEFLMFKGRFKNLLEEGLVNIEETFKNLGNKDLEVPKEKVNSELKEENI